MKSKYINTFNTTAEYNNYIESALPAFPNVGYDKEADKVNIVRTSPNDHLLYGEVVDPSQPIPTIQLYNNYSNVKTYTPTLDTLNNTFYIDDWGTVPTFNKLSGDFLKNKSNIKLIKKLKGLDTSKVTDMTNMFSNCSSLTSLDLSNFNTSNVTSMKYMFQYCSSLTSLDLSNFNTSNVTNMSFMFSNCSSLTSLDLSNWDTSNVTDMQYMFQYCSSLTSLDLSNWDTSNVTNMSSMFSGCSSLTSLNLHNLNISDDTNIGYMFDNCNSLTDVYINVESTLNKLTNNLTSQGSNYIPSSATIHYNGTDYKWTGSAWAPQN